MPSFGVEPFDLDLEDPEPCPVLGPESEDFSAAGADAAESFLASFESPFSVFSGLSALSAFSEERSEDFWESLP